MSHDGGVIDRSIRAVVVSIEDPARGEPTPTCSVFASVAEAARVGISFVRTAPDRRAAVLDVVELELGPGGHMATDSLAAACSTAIGIARAARAGQVLLRSTAAELVRDLPDGIELGVPRVHRLYGLPGTVSICSALGEDLSSSDLRSLDTVAPNLPNPTSPLVGRAELCRELRHVLDVERVVTLTGSGGTGKSRLALEVALAASGRFERVHWADLAPLASPGAVVDDLAAATGATHPSRDGRLELVISTLAVGRTLVVFDNAEHLIDGIASLVADLVSRCPRLTVLTTSREPLGISNEVVRRVPPLGVPDGVTMTAVASSEAGALLLDRLMRVGTAVAAEEAELLARICRQLDGVPLALELAAARSTTHGLADIAAGLTDRFALLSATRRDAYPRQRTLDASVRWSYDLLDPNEQRIFRHLAVFSGEFLVSDAVAVCPGPSARTSSVVAALVSQSLVGAANSGRLRLLETIRAFAEDRLAEAGEVAAARDRHLDWVVDALAALGPGFDGPDPARAMRSARQLVNDARAAMHHAERSGRSIAMWNLLELLGWWFFYEGRLDEAADWYRRACEVDEDAPPPAAAPGLVVGALLATSRGDHDEIVESISRASNAAERCGDHRSCGRLLVLRGAHQAWHNPAAGNELISAGRVVCESTSDYVWANWATCGAALALMFLGRPADSLVELARAEQVAASTGVRRLALDAAARRCICEYLLGTWSDAEKTLLRGRELAAGLTSTSVTACFDSVDASLLIERGRPDDAVELMERAIERYLRVGELQFVPLFVETVARAHISAGRASHVVQQLEDLRGHPGVGWAVVYRHWIDHTLASAWFACGDDDRARRVAQRLVDDAAEIGNQLDGARGELLLARLDVRAKEIRRGESRAHSALSSLLALGAVPAAIDALAVLADIDEEVGRSDRAGAIASHVSDARTELLAGSTPSLVAAVELARRGRGERRRARFGWDGLTRTELEVAALVADGLTNPQIAQRLVIGRGTAKTHVSSALRKLGIASRTQLATEYRARLGGAGTN